MPRARGSSRTSCGRRSPTGSRAARGFPSTSSGRTATPSNGPGGAAFLVDPLRERLTRTGHTVHGVPEVRTIPVVDLIGHPAVFCDAERSIREAARTMRDERASALLVRSREGLGIVTDRDLREK